MVTSALVAAAFAGVYGVPEVVFRKTHAPDLRAGAFVVVAGLLLGVTVACSQRRTTAALEHADRAARAFRTVAATSAALHQLDAESVLDVIIAGALALGYDGASISIIDDETDTFTLKHAQGIAANLGGGSHPASGGITGLVRREGRAVMSEAYGSLPGAISAVQLSGVRCAIAAPLTVNGRLVGVLGATSLLPRPDPAGDLEVIESLAAVAIAALANAEDYQLQHTVAAEQRSAASTDPLTGLPNRRAADHALVQAGSGDVVVLIDLDHFRLVNERLGHAGGDVLLRGISEHLRSGLRDQDFLARYGGEEFVIILPTCDLPDASSILDRLAHAWRNSHPAATFSAGMARHDGRDIYATLAEADSALYTAKKSGRDQTCAYSPLASLES